MEQIPEGHHGRYYLTQDSGHSGTYHTPSENKDKDGVQDNVDHGSRQSADHGKLRISVCTDDGIHGLTEHIEGDSQGNIEKVLLGMIKGLLIYGSAKHGNDLVGKKQVNGSQDKADGHHHEHRVSYTSFCGMGFIFPRLMLTKAQQPAPTITARARATTVRGKTTVLAAFP